MRFFPAETWALLGPPTVKGHSFHIGRHRPPRAAGTRRRSAGGDPAATRTCQPRHHEPGDRQRGIIHTVRGRPSPVVPATAELQIRPKSAKRRVGWRDWLALEGVRLSVWALVGQPVAEVDFALQQRFRPPAGPLSARAKRRRTSCSQCVSCRSDRRAALARVRSAFPSDTRAWSANPADGES